MEPKPLAELSKLDERQPSSGQEQASRVNCNNEVEERIQEIKEAMVSRGINLTSEDIEVLRIYLVSKPKWEEVYRRLADS